ncbi:ImmA/IrrE family metallo-endopeptidase [Thermotalea metallivorans]|uniref:IrrE N-terminal-like domain-containing protein n=1 Tax=Thermotalea metallivorans TaxID=520762 RepID=A0A140LCH1_9FIRM|nr:ImmA/IrrE family metallo-endopeptidase [Thermotalea metallivorans]KXG78246.1 hypothetical protein AN619_02210 [Thermotalea metallivorans]
MGYLELLQIAEDENIEIIEMNLTGRNKGLYADNIIAIGSNIDTTIEKTCILAEELGHYYTSFSDIVDQTKIGNRKQERRARAWGYEQLVSIEKLVQASDEGIRNKYELAEYLGVTEEFLESTLKYYKEKYGICYKTKSCIVYFDPLWIYKSFE